MTVDLPRALLDEAKRVKRVAAEQGLTLQQVLEMGLREVVANRKPLTPFRLRKHTVGGNGLVKDLEWPEIRERIYERRGG